MSTITMTNADKVLKTVYLDVINECINLNVNPFLAKINKSTSDICGKNIKRVVRQGISGGVGAGGEDGPLPTPFSSLYKDFTLTLKNLYGIIEFTDKLIKLSNNSSAAMVNVINDEMDTLVKTATINFGRMLFGDGSGILGKITGKEGYSFFVDSVKNFIPGQAVQIRDAEGELLYDELYRVIGVDRNKKKIRLSGNLPDLQDVYVTLQNAYDNEITGLKRLFDVSSDIYGCSREIDSYLAPRIFNDVGEISEMIIQQAIDSVEEDTGSKIDFILCSSGVKRAFMHHLSTYKRNLDVMELNGGYKAISYNGIPIVSDRFCPDGTMYLLNSKDFTLHQLCDWEWLEDDNGSILKQLPDRPVYKATLVKYADLVCARPCGQAMLSGITEM